MRLRRRCRAASHNTCNSRRRPHSPTRSLRSKADSRQDTRISTLEWRLDMGLPIRVCTRPCPGCPTQPPLVLKTRNSNKRATPTTARMTLSAKINPAPETRTTLVPATRRRAMRPWESPPAVPVATREEKVNYIHNRVRLDFFPSINLLTRSFRFERSILDVRKRSAILSSRSGDVDAKYRR